MILYPGGATNGGCAKGTEIICELKPGYSNPTILQWEIKVFSYSQGNGSIADSSIFTTIDGVVFINSIPVDREFVRTDESGANIFKETILIMYKIIDVHDTISFLS